jgi:hypothetical protein
VALLARVGSLTSALAFVGFSVGGVVGGVAVDKMGFTAAVLFASVIYFFATLTPVLGHQTWKLLDTVSRPVKKFVADAKITIRLVLSGQQWTATARRRDGAVLVKKHPVDPDRVTHALWLLHPPELESTLQAMLSHEQSEARERERALRAALAAAEQRLTAVTTAAAAADRRLTSASVPVTGSAVGPAPGSAAGSAAAQAVDAAAGPGSGTGEPEGVPVPEIIPPREPADDPAPSNGNGHHQPGRLGETAEFSLTRPEDDLRRST